MLRAGLAVALVMMGAVLMPGSETAGARDDVVSKRVAQIQAARSTFSDLPREAVRGYPVPVVQRGKVYLAFLFFLRRGTPPKPPELTAPGWVAYIDVDSGDDVSIERLETGPGEVVGTHTIEPPLDMKQYRQAEARLFDAISALLPVARRPQSGVPADLAAEAEQFRSLWSQLAHKPLASHYKSLNPAWFAALSGT